jgi:AraC-like DNA-binding protein
VDLQTYRNGSTSKPGLIQSRLLGNAVLCRLAYYPRAGVAVEYVLGHLSTTIRLHDIACAAGMNTSAFSRYFAERIGLPFSVVVRVLRIERAILELEKSDCSVSFLAQYAGYGSAESFTRAFKLVTGKTPSEYRREQLLADRVR